VTEVRARPEASARFMNVLEVNRRTFAPDSPGWLAMQQAFREMGDAGARHCRPVLLILYPYLFPGYWTLETYPERDIHQRWPRPQGAQASTWSTCCQRSSQRART